MSSQRSSPAAARVERDLSHLTNGVDEGLKGVIGVKNELYGVGLRVKSNVEMDLPVIVVCGAQSTGKSSLLERIAQEEFLRQGTDIQTRCPIVLQLVHTNDGSKWVEFPDENPKNKRYTDMNEVRAKIQRHNQTIIDSEQVVSEEPLMIRLHSPSVPNFTLVDLPGLKELPATDDQHIDLVEKTNDLVKNYISNENSIILAVSAATSDIDDSKAIRMAREVDPDGKRTLGVLTKLDLLLQGTDATEVLKGHRIKLDLGIVGVVNRGYLDLLRGTSLDEQLEIERQYLETQYPGLANTNGIPYLICRISALLMSLEI